MNTPVGCPRCMKEMDSELVVCWKCWRATNRLSNVHAYWVGVWDDARDRRHPELASHIPPRRPSTADTGIFLCEDQDE
jgi:hypothetical protein